MVVVELLVVVVSLLFVGALRPFWWAVVIRVDMVGILF